MKLAALGVVTVGIGVVLGVPGLMGIGLFWVAMGFPVRIYGRKLKGLRTTSPEGTTDAQKPGRTSVPDGRTFALGTLLWVVLGVPSLTVGALEIGVGAEHDEWRWLPIIVGGFALGVGVVGAVLFLMGSAVLAAGSGGQTPEIRAVVRIQAMRETGTYINERPRLEFEFLVEPDPATGLASYEVIKKATVPFTAMAALKVGSGFHALVAGSESPTTMEIHWDEPVPEGAGTEGGSTERGSGVAARLDSLDRLYRDGKVTEAEYETQRQRILGSL